MIDFDPDKLIRDHQVHYRKYRHGEFKYITSRDHYYQTNVTGLRIETPYIELYENGVLFIRKGYAWDGASGPTIDTKSSMRGSLIHDALYQLMRRGQLDINWRPVVDRLFYDVLIEDGMWEWRAKRWHKAVSKYAHSAAKLKIKGKVHVAP